MQTAVATAPAASQLKASGEERGGRAMAQIVDEEPAAGPGQIVSAAHGSTSHDLDGALTHADFS